MASVEVLRLDDGRSICLRRWPGQGVPIVLLHGLLDSSEGWEIVCRSVSNPCVAIDLPGFGYSDAPAHGHVVGYARDVAQVLAAIGLNRYTVVGHSLGGAVAAALADLEPERVASLVLLAPAGFGRIRLAEAVSLPGIRRITEAALPHLLSNRLVVTVGYLAAVSNGVSPDGQVLERIVHRAGDLVPGAREGTRAVAAAGRSDRALHRRRLRYRGPVFVAWGDRDRLVPLAHLEGVRTALPQLEVTIWPGVGHHFQRECLAALVGLVQRAAAPGRVPGSVRSTGFGVGAGVRAVSAAA